MTTRLITFACALVFSIIWITVLSLLLPDAAGNIDRSFAGELLLDRYTRFFPYPFTIQNLMWMVFFVGVGELFVRYSTGQNEADQLDRHLLPEDDQTVLRKQDLGDVYRNVRLADPTQQYWLQRMSSRSILAFQSTGSVEQVSSVFNSALDLFQHEMDLRYNLLRYLVWLIPTMGFIGTVVGIALALRSAGLMFADVGESVDLETLGPQLMTGLTTDLGVAFYTTLLALLQSAILMFAMHLIQGHEENTLNQIGQYCLDNLINRLYSKR